MIHVRAILPNTITIPEIYKVLIFLSLLWGTLKLTELDRRLNRERVAVLLAEINARFFRKPSKVWKN